MVTIAITLRALSCWHKIGRKPSKGMKRYNLAESQHHEETEFTKVYILSLQ